MKIVTFAIAGFAAGLASAITVSRISMGQPAAGAGVELEANRGDHHRRYRHLWRAWRHLALDRRRHHAGAGQYGFNILNADPFFKDLTTGLIIVAAVAISASGRRR